MAPATLTHHGPTLAAPHLPQHIATLTQRGTAARMARAQVKRDLNAGRITLEQALRHSDAERIKLVDLLAAQRQWGEVTASRYLAKQKIIASKRVGDLTDRQIEALCA